MKNFHYTKTSKRKPQEALKMVQEETVRAGLAVIQTLDVCSILKSKGLEIPAAFIVEICEPKLAHRLINDDPLILHFLPCKILIFTEAEQTVVSGTMPPLMEHYMPRADFSEVSPVIEEAVIRIVNAAL